MPGCSSSTVFGSLFCGALFISPVSAICHALALSGGGNRGAYEAGVLSGLVNNLPASDVRWDVVTGISAGAINAIGLATYPVGQEVNATAWLVDTVVGLTQSQVYKNWPLGVVQGISSESGIYNSAPLSATLAKLVGNPPNIADRKLVIGAASLNTGDLITWTEADKNELITAVMASAAIPGIFPAIEYNGDVLSDGGDIIGINIFDAIHRCQETESDDKNIIVDVVTTWSDKLAPINADKYHSLDVIQRKSDLASLLKIASAYEDALIAYPNVTWRYNVAPTGTFPATNELAFNSADLQTMVQMGVSDAVAAIAAMQQKQQL